MYYSKKYMTPIGVVMLASDGDNLIGLRNEGQKYYGGSVEQELTEKDDLPLFKKAEEWLDEYFAGSRPDLFELPLAPTGSEFRKEVWKILCEIPYGEYITYGGIADLMAERMKKPKMSSQAVGGAVGHNPISIIIPCHRVVGANGSLTGYAGGIEKKIKLLEHEGVDMSGLFIPAKGTAL